MNTSSTSDSDDDETSPVVGVALLGALGYGGYRVVKHRRERAT